MFNRQRRNKAPKKPRRPSEQRWQRTFRILKSHFHHWATMQILCIIRQIHISDHRWSAALPYCGILWGILILRTALQAVAERLSSQVLSPCVSIRFNAWQKERCAQIMSCLIFIIKRLDVDANGSSMLSSVRQLYVICFRCNKDQRLTSAVFTLPLWLLKGVINTIISSTRCRSCVLHVHHNKLTYIPPYPQQPPV